MKKHLICLAALLLCIVLPVCAFAEYAFVQLGTDAYEEADSASRRVTNYKAGTWVELAGDGSAQEAEYVSVTGPDGITGYVPLESVFILSQTPAEQTAVVANNGKYVNLRAGASKQADVLTKLNHGTPMLLLETGKSFDHVLVGGVEGYMASGLVKVGGAAIATLVVSSSNGKNVNLRDEPSTNGAVLKSVSCGTSVSVFMQGDGWSYVRIGNTDGFMMTKFLAAKESPVPGPVPNPDPDSDFWDTGVIRYVYNRGASVRYRSGPGGSAKVLGKLATGKQVYEVSTNGHWSKIEVGSKTGYIMSKYLVTIMPDPDIDDPVIYDSDD